MKHTKRTLSLLLALLCLFSLAGCATPQGDSSPSYSPVASPTLEPQSRIGEETLQYPAENDEYKYNVYETYVEIQEYIGDATDVAVPVMLDELPVKVVKGFYFNKTIKNVVLPEGLVVIYNCAFDSCSSLETINIPETVTEIGYRAFYDCTSLKSLTIPKSVTEIGSHAVGIGSGTYGGYALLEGLVVKFYKGSAAAQYIADTAFNIKYEIINE
ncbi:MAG: leucine-rich repeat domain-containing protein [Clostridia bacterium]|nr:leucine-rich repeat domain-containing protein [Clostridia bacterium]